MKKNTQTDSLPTTYAQALAHSTKRSSASSAAQTATALNHFLKAIGKSLDSPIGNELLEEFESSKNRLYARTTSLGLAEATYASTVSRISSLRTATIELISDSSLPHDFHRALEELIARSTYTFADIEMRVGSTVNKWRHQKSLPSERSISKLRAIEQFLGAPGALLTRLPHLTRHVNIVDELDPSDGLPTDFGRCLRTLRKRKGICKNTLILKVHEQGGSISKATLSRWELRSDSPTKIERSIIGFIEKILEVKGPLLRRYDAIISSTDPHSPVLLTNKAYGFWNECLEKEFTHLAWFKSTGSLPPGIKRNREGTWNRDASRKIWKTNLRLFFGFCRQPASHADPMLRGEGIDERDLSLALLLDSKLVRAFCDFRRDRNSAKSYNASTVSFIAGIRNLVHRQTGYFTQHPNLFCNKPRIQPLLPTSVEVQFLHTTTTQQLVHIQDRFVALCQQAHANADEFLRNLTLGGKAKQTRDPARRIKKILETEQPLEAFLVLLDRMERSTPPHLARTKLAVHFTNVALVSLMNVKPLRCRTLTELRPNEIYRNHDRSWHANVPKERFKNANFGGRDGWVGEIHNSVWSVLDRYWDQARPYLTFGKNSDRFWVNSNGTILTESSLHTRFLAFTKQFIPDLAPEGINPHAWRKVVSHDNFKTDRINAITKSAQQLNDLPKTITKSYAMDSDNLRNDWVNHQTDQRLKNRKRN
jgi:hypothetical protein